ncbi:MAG: LpqB family beta-propeller domain-containing protein [Propionibacteriaceae bacterium]
MKQRFYVVILAALILLSGCARVPTSGPIKVEPQRTNEAKQAIDIIPHAPAIDDKPNAIVQGFLHSMAEGRGDYGIAREYLSSAVANSWNPSLQTLIYDAARTQWSISDSNVVLKTAITGRLDHRGTYRQVAGEAYTLDFGLVQENGQWRISRPPSGLLLLQDLFDHSFVSVTTYFYDPSYRVLVPDIIQIPKQKRTANFIVSQLMAGPTEWLRPAVRTGIPGQSALAGAVTVTSDGIVTVPLAGNLSHLDDTARSLFAAQIAVTLNSNLPPPGEARASYLKIILNGYSYSLPQSDTNGVVPLSLYTRYLPTALQSSGQLFGIQDNKIVLIKDTIVGGEITQITGVLGDFKEKIDLLGVATDASSVAMVTDSRSRLWTSSLAGNKSPRLVLQSNNLFAPQWTRFDEAWTMSSVNGSTTIYRIVDGQAQAVDAPDLKQHNITDFRISPDGCRIAVIMEQSDKKVIAILRIRREEKMLIDGLQILDMQAKADIQPESLGWRSDTKLAFLGREANKVEVDPFEMDQEAVVVRRTSTQTWDVSTIRTMSFNNRYVAYALGESGQVWRRSEDSVWRRWATGISNIAVAG